MSGKALPLRVGDTVRNERTREEFILDGLDLGWQDGIPVALARWKPVRKAANKPKREVSSDEC